MPHEEEEIYRKALRQGKKIAFSKETCLEKERVRSKVTPRKIGVELKRSGELIAPINSRVNVVVRSPIPFGLGRNGCWLSRVAKLPRALLALSRCNLL